MERYANRSGKSGVEAFEIFPDAIHVRFKGEGRTYRYSYKIPGQTPVEKMKKLAAAGEGLATYISQVIRQRFERRV